MRHPLNETGNDHTEKVVKWIIDSEDAVVVERIQEKTQKDPKMQKIAQRVAKADWEKHRRDRDIEPFRHVKNELSVAEGLIFRENRIVLPDALHRKVGKLGHKLGQLGRTKTEQMLRQKYWFPLMNSMIGTTVDQCYECKVTTEDHREEQEQEGFQHHKITPLHPRANGEVERFMQMLNNTERISPFARRETLRKTERHTRYARGLQIHSTFSYRSCTIRCDERRYHKNETTLR